MKQFLIFLLCVSSFISCKKVDPFVEEVPSTLRGLFGSVELYSEFGTLVSDFSNVLVTARCVDTLTVDSSGAATAVFDSTLHMTTNEIGEWRFEDCPRGFYFITCSKDGFGENCIARHWYDTVRADTLSLLALAKAPLSSVVFDSVRYANGLLYLSRTISFTTNHGENYPASSWYFFDTTANVSATNHMYAYLSGASYGNKGKPHSYTVQKAVDNLRLYGFSEGDSVYVCIGVDNYKFITYQNFNQKWVFPNVTETSSIKSFHIDSFYDK